MQIRTLAWVLVVAVVAGGVAASAQGQENKGRDAAIKAALKKIESGEAKDQSAGRMELVELFNHETTPAGQAAVAAGIAKQATPVLARLDGQRAATLAVAISQVHDAAIQPALESMIRHKDTGVRILGWRGYLWADADKNIREQIVQNPAAAATMWKSLAERMAKENSSAVFGFIFDMMRLPTTVRKASGPGVDAKNFQMLDAAWKDICQKVIDGDEEMTRAARSAVAAMEYFYKNLPSAEAKNKTISDLVVMMYCAAKSYDLESAEGDLAEAAKQVLLDAEVALSGLTEKKIKDMADRAVRDQNVQKRGPAALLAAYEWAEMVKLDSNEFAGFQPRVRTKVTTQPASMPATSPSK